MTMRHGFTAAIILTAACATSASAASFDTLGPATDSASFPYKYEGNVLPTAAGLGFTYAPNNNITEATAASIIGGNVLRINTAADGNTADIFGYRITGSSTFDPPDSNPWRVDFRGGWTVEFRAHIRNTEFEAFGTPFGTSDENSTGLLQIYDNQFVGDDGQVVASVNGDGFHTYRIASISIGGDSSQQKYYLYKDGALVATFDDNVSFPPNPLLQFGDFQSSTAEIDFDLDYFRWTNVDALPPVVPEPTTLAAAAGALALVGRRRR